MSLTVIVLVAAVVSAGLAWRALGAREKGAAAPRPDASSSREPQFFRRYEPPR
jgi:hypothetical protein